VRESIEGRDVGSRLRSDAEKSLINEMCSVSVPVRYLFNVCLLSVNEFRWLIEQEVPWTWCLAGRMAT